MKNKQNKLNQENSQLKEILNTNNYNKEQMDINNQNKIQNISLYQTVTGNGNNFSKFNENMANMNLSTNKYVNSENPVIYNKDLNYNNNLNYTYSNNVTNTSYVDPKEGAQKRALNEFKNFLNKMDEKIDMS